MRTLFRTASIVIIGFFLSATANADEASVIRLSEPVAADQTSETFGSILPTGLPVFTLEKLLADSAQQQGKQVLLQTRISKVCQKKGCFFIAQQDQTIMRVSFKDYGFFIPTDSAGKDVVLAGELIAKKLDEKEAAHYNQDLGENSNMLAPGMVYELVADAIQIPKG